MSATSSIKNIGKDAVRDTGRVEPLDEEEDERAWEAKFAASKDLLVKLAEEARQERKRGKTAPLDVLLDE